MELAQKEERLIITFDRDYGELIYKHNYQPEQGVLYVRLLEYLPEEPGKIVHQLHSIFKLETSKRLTVVGPTTRQRS
jgi:hypothetical protein